MTRFDVLCSLVGIQMCIGAMWFERRRGRAFVIAVAEKLNKNFPCQQRMTLFIQGGYYILGKTLNDCVHVL